LVVLLMLLLFWSERTYIYWILLLLAIPLVGLMLLSMEAVRPVAILSGSAIITFIASFFVYGVLGIGLAFSTPMPMTSILARITYAGVFGHFQSLQQFAQRWGWQFHKPADWPPTAQIQGTLNGREVAISSGLNPGLPRAHYLLRISLAAAKPHSPFFVSYSFYSLEPDKIQQRAAMAGTCRSAIGLRLKFYLWPSSAVAHPDALLFSLTAVLEARRRFLRPQTAVRSNGQTIEFIYADTLRIGYNTADIQELVMWLETLAQLMESTETTVDETAGFPKHSH
jgi:hypothetical protein